MILIYHLLFICCRLGLEGNYTPIKNTVQPAEAVPEEPEDEEEEEDDGEDEKEIEGTEFLVKPKTEGKVINNQKVVSESQIEDELKKYCEVDTSK